MNFLTSLEKYFSDFAFFAFGLTVAGLVHIFLDVNKVKKLINTGKLKDVFTSALMVFLFLCAHVR